MTVTLSILFYFLLPQFVKPIQVDQRQNGELNVQVDLRDVQIIALLNRGKEEYVVSFKDFKSNIFTKYFGSAFVISFISATKIHTYSYKSCESFEPSGNSFVGL